MAAKRYTLVIEAGSALWRRFILVDANYAPVDLSAHFLRLGIRKGYGLVRSDYIGLYEQMAGYIHNYSWDSSPQIKGQFDFALSPIITRGFGMSAIDFTNGVYDLEKVGLSTGLVVVYPALAGTTTLTPASVTGYGTISSSVAKTPGLAYILDPFSPIKSVTFTGTGLNDLYGGAVTTPEWSVVPPSAIAMPGVIGGVMLDNQTTKVTVTIQIQATGATDTIMIWTTGATDWDYTSVPMVIGPPGNIINLPNSAGSWLYASFVAKTGHTVGDKWTIVLESPIVQINQVANTSGNNGLYRVHCLRADGAGSYVAELTAAMPGILAGAIDDVTITKWEESLTDRRRLLYGPVVVKELATKEWYTTS